MKAKIDEYGNLGIERKGEWKAQSCPHEGEGNWCGDWCPLFEEGTDSESGISFVQLRCALDGVVHQVVSDERA